MYNVVMRTIYGVVYTVERGLTYLGANERVTWLLAMDNADEYFNGLMVNRIQIIDTETGDSVMNCRVGL